MNGNAPSNHNHKHDRIIIIVAFVAIFILDIVLMFLGHHVVFSINELPLRIIIYSLLAALFTLLFFGLLTSEGNFQTKSGKLKGAAAVFMIIFLGFPGVEQIFSELSHRDQSETIRQLRSSSDLLVDKVGQLEAELARINYDYDNVKRIEEEYRTGSEFIHYVDINIVCPEGTQRSRYRQKVIEVEAEYFRTLDPMQRGTPLTLDDDESWVAMEDRHGHFLIYSGHGDAVAMELTFNATTPMRSELQILTHGEAAIFCDEQGVSTVPIGGPVDGSPVLIDPTEPAVQADFQGRSN